MSTQPDPQRPTRPTPATTPAPAPVTSPADRSRVPVRPDWDEIWLESKNKRSDVVITWVGWHALELAGVGVPVVLAFTVAWWWMFIALVAGGLWAGHEIRVSRRHKRLRAAIPGPRTTGPARLVDAPSTHHNASDDRASAGGPGLVDGDESGRDVRA